MHNNPSAAISFNDCTPNPITLLLTAAGTFENVRRALRAGASNRPTIIIDAPDLYAANVCRHLAAGHFDNVRIKTVHCRMLPVDIQYIVHSESRPVGRPTPMLDVYEVHGLNEENRYSGPLFKWVGAQRIAYKSTGRPRGRPPKNIFDRHPNLPRETRIPICIDPVTHAPVYQEESATAKVAPRTRRAPKINSRVLHIDFTGVAKPNGHAFDHEPSEEEYDDPLEHEVPNR